MRQPRQSDGQRLKVVHVSPTYFAPESFVGGGERFVAELARAMGHRADVKLVAFGPRPMRRPIGSTGEHVVLRNWTRHKMSPFSPMLARELSGADIVHCHQYFTTSTFLAAWLGRFQGSRVFVTDLGGGGWTPGYQIDVSRWIDGHLPLSDYAARELPGENRKRRVIGGGVDVERFAMRPRLEHDGSVVFLGRILPHKGVHFLIRGLPSDIPLHVIGPAVDTDYLSHLRGLAAGKPVSFHHSLDDAGVIRRLQSAMALVHPTPVDAQGHAGAHELFGLALVEAMACGCPVIASRAASLPEIVVDGTTGRLVMPNEAPPITEAILSLARDLGVWQSMARASRERAEREFGWAAVVERCLDAYGGLTN